MKNIVTQLHKEVIEYFATADMSQISHTEAVHNFTQLIASLERCDEKTQAMLEMAALLHDIGCPNAKVKYGNTNPPNQEKEGKPKTIEILAKYNMPEEDKQLLAEVVGLHHHLKELQKLGFGILAEADMIVNLIEGYYHIDQAAVFYEIYMQTKSGKDLYRNMFLKED